MKQSVLFFAMTVITFSLQAQTEKTYTEAFDSVFINISRADATTGILYERVVPFANLLNYNSRVSASIDTSNYSHFIQAYSELYRAAFNPSARLPWTLERFEEEIVNGTTPGIVDIGILHYNFNVMDSVVGKQKLIKVNGVLVENPAITASLYLYKTAFVASPLSAAVDGTSGITFRLKNDFYFSNTNTYLTQLLVDFDDGQGLRAVSIY